MARKVIWTDGAWADLEEIADYITKDSPFYAAAVVREVRDAARSLSTLAARGRMVPEVGDPHIRELFVRSYRLLYVLVPAKAYILGVIHGARDLSRFWKR